MRRRDLLTRLGTAAGALACGAMAAAEEAEEVRARVNTRSEPSQLQITDLRVVPIYTTFRPHVIRIETNQGICGYGEVQER